MTIVRVRSRQEDSGVQVTLFVSEEYFPRKQKDSDGNILPGQEWQHPDPRTLRFNELGTLTSSERVDELIEVILMQGVAQLGGHIRVIDTVDFQLLQGGLETWVERRHHEEAELEAEQERNHQEYLCRNQRLYEHCGRCGARTESCQNVSHRGQTPCMECGGGLGDTSNRFCVNCVDLPWREKREQHLGRPIVYKSEKPIEI